MIRHKGESDLLPQQKTDLHAKRILLLLALLLLAAISLSIAIGRFSIPLGSAAEILLSRIIPLGHMWTDQMENILLTVRLPRILGAILVGAALSVSGAAYQGMFRNPLVSPDLLGVSAGACVGAASGILLHIGGLGIELFALLGGILAVSLAVMIPRLFRNSGKLMLVLAGVLVSGLMNSILSSLKYIADADSELAEIVYWTMGSLASVRWHDLLIVAPGMLLAMVVLFALRWRMNLLALGEKDAHSLGMNVKLVKGIVIVCATLLTSAAICLSGTIGWIGLVIPHMCRLLVGEDNKNLFPASLIVGGCFLVLTDTVCRNLTVNEIPLSIFTGIIGVPLFLWLLLMQRTRIEE